MHIPPLKQTIEEVCDEFKKGTILKEVEDRGDIVGSVRSYLENGTVSIGKLMVYPKMQNKGIGTKLLFEIEWEMICSLCIERKLCILHEKGRFDET